MKKLDTINIWTDLNEERIWSLIEDWISTSIESEVTKDTVCKSWLEKLPERWKELGSIDERGLLELS
jgi:hypothetical protein